MASIRADRRTADVIVGTLAARAETTRITIAATTPRLLSATLAVRRQYTDLNLDLADGAAVVLAAEYRTDVLLTLDRRDFRAIRPLTGDQAFTVERLRDGYAAVLTGPSTAGYCYSSCLATEGAFRGISGDIKRAPGEFACP